MAGKAAQSYIACKYSIELFGGRADPAQPLSGFPPPIMLWDRGATSTLTEQSVGYLETTTYCVLGCRSFMFL